MRNNPIVPYILIMAFGIGLIFFMSLEGAGNQEEIANGGEATAESDATAGGEQLVSSCIGCHGGDLTGGAVGPSLVGLDSERIVDVLTNGIAGTPMTPGMKNPAEAQAIADYISTLK